MVGLLGDTFGMLHNFMSKIVELWWIGYNVCGCLCAQHMSHNASLRGCMPNPSTSYMYRSAIHQRSWMVCSSASLMQWLTFHLIQYQCWQFTKATSKSILQYNPTFLYKVQLMLQVERWIASIKCGIKALQTFFVSYCKIMAEFLSWEIKTFLATGIAMKLRKSLTFQPNG